MISATSSRRRLFLLLPRALAGSEKSSVRPGTGWGVFSAPKTQTAGASFTSRRNKQPEPEPKLPEPDPDPGEGEPDPVPIPVPEPPSPDVLGPLPGEPLPV